MNPSAQAEHSKGAKQKGEAESVRFACLYNKLPVLLHLQLEDLFLEMPERSRKNWGYVHLVHISHINR